RKPERQRRRATDDGVAVPCAEHPLDRNQPLEADEPIGAAGLHPEVLADLHERPHELVAVAGRPDGDAHPTFSSGAYSSISRRSDPSSNRTVTTPSGSMRVTIPVPSVWWRTASPVESSGMSQRGAGWLCGGRPQPDPDAGRSD